MLKYKLALSALLLAALAFAGAPAKTDTKAAAPAAAAAAPAAAKAAPAAAADAGTVVDAGK